MRFFLSPTGTNTSARLLGEDTNGRDGWTLAWRYKDAALAAHLTVKAIGLGGSSPDTVLGLYHPEPNSGRHERDKHRRIAAIGGSLCTGPGTRRGPTCRLRRTVSTRALAQIQTRILRR